MRERYVDHSLRLFSISQGWVLFWGRDLFTLYEVLELVLMEECIRLYFFVPCTSHTRTCEAFGGAVVFEFRIWRRSRPGVLGLGVGSWVSDCVGC